MESPVAGSVAQHDSFDYEVLYRDSGRSKKNSTPFIESNPYIDPGVLKILHRIGRGPFGDVAIASLHYFTDEYDENHEVAVKMLNFITEDQMQNVLEKFEHVFHLCQGLQHVSWPYGLSVKNGKICLVMKFYECSIGDRMFHRRGNKLPVPDILRYGVDIAQGVMELHSKGILVLNLKPCNILLDENDHAVVGDFGIPMLLLGIPLSNADLELKLGTPNYMAPEQWEASIRGPVSFETDCWGFACSIIEMLTGVSPWHGKSASEIYNSVVLRHEKPAIPNGLPRAIEGVIRGCFEYNFRDRPSFKDILYAFRNPDAIFGDNGWICALDSIEGKTKIILNSHWSFLKDPVQVGDHVRSKKPRTSKHFANKNIVEGKAAGMDSNMFVLVKVHGSHDPLRIHASNLEKVTLGFAAGDWVKLNDSSFGQKQSSIGILHSIRADGKVEVAFQGLETLWTGNCSELQMAESFSVGQFVRIKATICSPRFKWPQKGNQWDIGRISWIFPNGCLLVHFPGRLFGNVPTLADAEELEIVQFRTCSTVVDKYQHLEALHWAIRPVLFTLGILSIIKLGRIVNDVSCKPGKKASKQAVLPYMQQSHDGQMGQDSKSSGNVSWFPPKVSNVLFREGLTS